jgi:predicted exporter
MIERLLRASYTYRRSVLLAATVALALGVVLVARLSFDANILRLLPRNAPASRSFALYLQQFGTVDHVYILFEVPRGQDIADHEAFIDGYVERLRRAPDIASVDAELFDDLKDWNYLFDRALLLLGKDEAEAALARLTPSGMAAQLTRSRSLLAMSSPQVKAYVQQDPLGVLALLRDKIGRSQALVEFDPGRRGYVSRDGRSRLVLAKPIRPPFDTDFCKRLFARLSDIEASARAAAGDDREEDDPQGARDVTVQVAGGYRIALDAERVIRREMVVNTASSLVVLLLLVVVVFRTLWILPFGTAPLIVAVVLTLGANGLRGPLSPATSGAAAMLFGLGIDGVVLLYLRFIEERQRGFSEPEAVARMAGTATSIVVAYGTTAVTFLALVLVDFPSLEDLGRLVGLGMFFCCLLVLTVVPALIGAIHPKVGGKPIAAVFLGRLVERHGRAILVLAAAATVVLGTAGTRLRLDASLDRLKTGGEGVRLEERLAAQFSLPQDVLIALGEGPALEPLLASAERLGKAVERAVPSAGVSSPTAWLPPAGSQDAVADLLVHAQVDPSAVAGDFERAAATAGFRPGTFRSFLDHLPRMLDRSQRVTYDGLVQHHLTALVSPFAARRENGYLVAVYLYPRTSDDIDRLAALVATQAASFRLTGVPVVNRELASRAMPQFLLGMGAGTLVVGLIIYFVFRSVRQTLLAFLPTALGLSWTAGLLSLAGADLDLFSLFAAMTFVGIATDYGIYIIYRYSREGTRPMRDVLATTGTGVMVAGAATLIGFGSLIGSSYPPLHSFGVTSVLAIASCLVAALLVLPALLQEVGGRS